MISQRNKLFRFNHCTFAVEREKESTARIVLFRELGLLSSYTLEVSFYGGEALSKSHHYVECSEEEEEEGEEAEEAEEEEEEAEEDSKLVRSEEEEERVIKLHCMKLPPQTEMPTEEPPKAKPAEPKEPREKKKKRRRDVTFCNEETGN